MSALETLTFPEEYASPLRPYLPPSSPNPKRPFTTLTYAQSLDAHLSLAPGVRTTLSGAETKAMTHWLRAHHDAILIGVGTAIADDPGLNCRLVGEGGEGSRQPRPVVLDPSGRWEVSEESKVVKLALEGKGFAPWVLVRKGVDVGEERRRAIEGVGGRYLAVPGGSAGDGLPWEVVLKILKTEGVESVMIEGGGKVINGLLELANAGVDVVDSVIVTVAPVWLGRGGVAVAPERGNKGAGGPRLGRGTRWVQMGDDVVLCGRIQK